MFRTYPYSALFYVEITGRRRNPAADGWRVNGVWLQTSLGPIMDRVQQHSDPPLTPRPRQDLPGARQWGARARAPVWLPAQMAYHKGMRATRRSRALGRSPDRSHTGFAQTMATRPPPPVCSASQTGPPARRGVKPAWYGVGAFVVCLGQAVREITYAEPFEHSLIGSAMSHETSVRIEPLALCMTCLGLTVLFVWGRKRDAAPAWFIAVAVALLGYWFIRPVHLA
jgi:hypothetical protein